MSEKGRINVEKRDKIVEQILDMYLNFFSGALKIQIGWKYEKLTQKYIIMADEFEVEYPEKMEELRRVLNSHLSLHGYFVNDQFLIEDPK